MAADWSYLPADLAALVAQRLTVYADHVRFGAACTAWRSAARARDGRPRAFLPCLFRDHPRLGETVEFLCLSGGEILHAPFPKSDRGFFQCIASSNGWFLLTGIGGCMFLFDPLSNSRADLPSIPNVSVELGCVSSDGSRTVMVSYSCCYDRGMYWLAYARPGDEKWTAVTSRLFYCCDSLYHHEGKFYVVDWTGEVLAIEITAADTPACVAAEVVAPSLQHSERSLSARKFIVFTPSGEMVLLFRATSDTLQKPPDFMAFVLVNGGSGRTEWKPVDAKQVLGDVLVLECHHSLFSIPRSILPFPISRLWPTSTSEWSYGVATYYAVHHQRQEDAGSYVWFQPNYK